MQSSYAAEFAREMWITEADWLRSLPGALGERKYRLASKQLEVELYEGSLTVSWQVESPRVMGLARFPRLRVSFTFNGLNPDERYVFMKRFDLYMHRGGG